MKSIFNKRFEEEFLLNEKLRTAILGCIFLTAMLGSITNLFIFENTGTEELNKGSLRLILFFQAGLCLFEFISFLDIKKKIKKNDLVMPLARQYVSAVVEISAPAIIIFLLSHRYHSPAATLHSPVVYGYFVFIILSTLRLNFRLSFITGLLAATSFLLLSTYLLNHAGPGYVVRTNDFAAAIAKSIIILVSGIGAAFVARQIRLSIDRSLAAAEAGNKIVNLFGQQISKEIVNEMLESDGSVRSKLTKVCVMFIDIRNFTKQVADKSPAEIVTYQNAFFKIVINAVTKHGGIINQFLGDGCMITFGAPVVLKNPSQQALNTAIEIHKELNNQIKKGSIPHTNIGIGIHVGDAVTGNIGTIERQQYSITGSVVILAARIEQLNKDYDSQILISEDVMHQIDHSLPSNPKFIGKVDLKGWYQPLGIYKIA